MNPQDTEPEESARSSGVDSGTSETSHGAAAPERVFVGTGVFWGLIIGVAVAVAMIIFAAQNSASTTVSFLGWDFSLPLMVLVLGSLLVGIVLDELFGLVYRKRRRRILSDREDLKRLH